MALVDCDTRHQKMLFKYFSHLHFNNISGLFAKGANRVNYTSKLLYTPTVYDMYLLRATIFTRRNQ